MNILQEAKRVFDTEIKALEITRDVLDLTFVDILNAVTECKGKVIITGMGKSGHIARKVAATLASLGTPSFYLHPAEALHGDLGVISSNDVVIAISYSGESEEITRILPNIKMIGAKLIAISSNADSTLVCNSDLAQIFPKFKEACYMGLAPTSSTTVALCYGDALAVVASAVYGFNDTDYGKRHPGGALGKKVLVKVRDLMQTDDENAIININSTLNEAIVQLSKKALGIVSVVDDEKHLLGVITDGDLRRLLSHKVDIYNLYVKDVMTVTPIFINPEKMAVDALHIMKENNISCLPVVENGLVLGTIRLQAIIKYGIV
ncbi:Arabinose 5-phosphate isomerase KdsD [bioreactor metagenome]|uniref:Arabinose 5-phosphate isomerase KdsD n=1 Tax=bioreactor metagenome TaxID=1076179 RepID=A0A645AHI3_9ZZZZ|nr:KpsF/GutQ family sugar-phosphate isomerase [Candidatus Metalachnospira sp.]